ncbi:MAG: phage tail protein [Candidatus Methanomethylicaceae archaeon]
MGKGPEVTFVYYTYEVRSAVAFAWGPIDVFLRFDVNDEFTVYNVHHGTADFASQFYNNGTWVLPSGGKQKKMTHTTDDYIQLEEGKKPLKWGRVYFGTETQGVDPSLDKYMGHEGWTPTYRHVAYLSAHWDLGTAPSMPATSFTFGRYFAACAGITHTVVDPDGGRGINPAQALYDILTSKWYGFGLEETYLDVDSFIAASETLYKEGLGIGIAITGGEVYNTVRAILDWIDGELVYAHGKISLVLRRRDYDLSSLILITEADIKARTFEFTRAAWAATKNVIYVNFNDIHREHDQNSVYAEDLANQLMTGQIRVQEYNFDVHTNVATAQKVVNRLLHRQSFPWAVVEFECFGIGAALELFKCFKLHHRYYNLKGVFRVTEKVRQGPNLWKIQAIEDSAPLESWLHGFEFEMDHPVYWDPSDVEWDVRFYESYYRGLLALPYSATPIYFKAGATYSWEEIGGRPGMEWYATPPMDSTLFLLDLDNDGDYEWADIKAYASVGFIAGDYIGQYLTPSGLTFVFTPDPHYMWDFTKVRYVLINNEIMELAKVEPYEDFKYIVTISKRGIETTEADYHPIYSRIFNIECRALNTEIPRLTTGTYDFLMVPHFLLPKPSYNFSAAKVKSQEYYDLIRRPMGWGYNSFVVFDPYAYSCKHIFMLYFESRLEPIPVPCVPLPTYPLEKGSYCPVEYRGIGVLDCGGHYEEIPIDKRSGIRVSMWTWSGYFDHDGLKYYFNASTGGPTDPDSAWTNATYAFDPSIDNYATCTKTGSQTTNYLWARGTGVPAMPLDFKGVKARIYGMSGVAGTEIHGIVSYVGPAGMSVLGTLSWSQTSLYDDDNVPIVGSGTRGYGPYARLDEPISGWSLSSLQNLEVTLWMTGPSEAQAGVAHIEVFLENSLYKNAHLGISSNTPVWVFELPVGADMKFSFTTADVVSRGVTYGYRLVIETLGAVENLTEIWSITPPDGGPSKKDIYIFYDDGWHILRFTGKIGEPYPMGYSFDLKPVYLLDWEGV